MFALSQTEGVETVVSNGWPADAGVSKDVTGIVLHTRLGGTVLFRGPQRRQVDEMLKQGVGVTAIHWGTGAETPEGGPWLQTMGAWFNAEGDGFSKYRVQTSKLQQADPKHPICRGWSGFELREEIYYNLCFLPDARPLMTTVVEGKDSTIGWVYERREFEKRAASFGASSAAIFTPTSAKRPFRQAVVNGIAVDRAHRHPGKGRTRFRSRPKDMELPPEAPKKK